jgi:hypothetical protein
MIINENNIPESLRVMNKLKEGVLEGKDSNEELKYVISPREELSAVVEIFACLEMNDRYGKSNPPTPKQLDYALSLAKRNPEKAKEVLKSYGKATIDKLDPKECSEFIDIMRVK